MPTTTQHIPKKINRDALQTLRRDIDHQFDRKSLQDGSTSFLLPPMNSVQDYATLQYAIVADFLTRIQGGDVLLSSNPSLNANQSSNGDIVWKSRQKLIDSFSILFDVYGIVSDRFLHTLNIPKVQSLFPLTQQLYEEHQISSRWDVCYYNIYTSTAVPDHRVVYKQVESIRYHIRFFFGSKNDTIVCTIDNPCFLFGCVAILVHPQDRRYKKLIGKEVIIPLINRTILIVAHESVSQEGHGTHLLIPAHNRIDFSLALELGLPYNVYAVDHFGLFTDAAKDFKGKHKDEFESNIIQFIDDIANLEKKESLLLSIPTDGLTGHALLPLLQRNVYLSLTDGSLHDASLVSNSSFLGISDLIHTTIEREEQRCVSSYDITQPHMPFYIQDNDEDRVISCSDVSAPLWYRLLRDVYLLNLVSFPAKGETIVQSLVFEINEVPVWKLLIDCYNNFYETKELDAVRQLLHPFSYEQKDQDYASSLDAVLSLLDHTSGILFSNYGYLLDVSASFYYDHEYLSILLLSAQVVESNLSILYDPSYSYWIKHFLYLYNKLHKKKIDQASFVALSVVNDPDYVRMLTESYPGDVARIALISRMSLTGDEIGDVSSLSADYIYRFLNKRRNASRLLFGQSSDTASLFSLDSFAHYIQDNQSDFSDYDMWIITKIRYVWEEFHYYSTKYAFNKAVHLVVESLRYDISERSLFIMKFAPTEHTKFIVRMAIYVSCHLLYSLAPAISLGMLSCLGLQLDYNSVHRFFADIEVKKNYKCSLMMDAMTERALLIDQYVKKDQIFVLYMQSNKDFSDYITKYTDNIITYFGGSDKVSLIVLTELESFPEGCCTKDLLTIKVGLSFSESPVRSSTPSSTISLSALQGQLAYKRQLLQTMRNTIVRLRSSLQQKTTLDQLQKDVDVLQHEIEKLEYQISKMKYF